MCLVLCRVCDIRQSASSRSSLSFWHVFSASASRDSGSEFDDGLVQFAGQGLQAAGCIGCVANSHCTFFRHLGDGFELPGDFIAGHALFGNRIGNAVDHNSHPLCAVADRAAARRLVLLGLGQHDPVPGGRARCERAAVESCE